MERLKSGLVAAVAVAVLAAATGCGSGRPEIRLLDGSSPPSLPEPLARLSGRLVLTRVSVLSAKAIGPQLESCLRDARSAALAAQVRSVVARVGVAGRSLSFKAGRNLYGCDMSAGFTYREGRTWCGFVSWWYPFGASLDPRVHVGSCLDRDKRDVAFAWVLPTPRTRWLTVEEPGYREVYEVAGSLPVRITSHEIATEFSGAVFRIRYYDRSGREIGRRVLEAHVAN